MIQLHLNDIIPFLDSDHQIFGNTEFVVSNVQTAENINAYSLDWVNPIRKKKLEYIVQSKAKVILCDLDIQVDDVDLANRCIIKVANPKMTFIRITSHFFQSIEYKGKHSSAIIHPSTIINESCFVGPNTYIGKCKLGKNTIIHGNCYLYDNVTVGDNVVIHANTVIGADGFGYQRNEDGTFEKFPHIGGVIIEDDVEIGANTCIDRGALGNTIIRNGAKIDNLVHIAHNVVIGRNTAVIANAMIAGSVVVGENTWIAPSVSIRDQVTIGNNVTIGMSSLVTKNIPNDEVWIGSPAKKLR